MANIEKMNVYIITKDKVTKSEKEGRWFNNLFLPLFRSNKDPLKKQPKLDEYWNEIRNCLTGKKKNKNLKVIKHKDIKFIAFPVANNQVLAFAIGTEKSEALNDIYKLTQEKSEGMTYEKFLKVTNIKHSEAMENFYNNLCQAGITDKDIKDWGYKNINDLIKRSINDNSSYPDKATINDITLPLYHILANYTIKDWVKEIIKVIDSKYSNQDFVGIYEQEEQSSASPNILGTWIISKYIDCCFIDVNNDYTSCSLGDLIEYCANKEVIDNEDKIFELIGLYYLKKKNKTNKNKDSFDITIGTNYQGSVGEEFKNAISMNEIEKLWNSGNGKYNGKDIQYIIVYKQGTHDEIKTFGYPQIKHSEILDWLSEHDQAWNDFCEHFGIEENEEPTLIIPEDTVAWISDHDMLYEDFCNHFKLDPDFVENEEPKSYIENDIEDNGAVMATIENINESIAEVQYDYENKNISFSEALDTIMEIDSTLNESKAKQIINSWKNPDMGND